MSIRATPPDPPRPANPTRLHLVRHGQSTWNDQRRIQGQLDPPLSDLGHSQAERAGRRFASQTFGALYCSDLQRARQTADHIAEALGMTPLPMPELREIALGDWEGMTAEEVRNQYPEHWDVWVSEPSWDIVPGSEGQAPFERRVGEAIDAIFDRHHGEDVLVVTHGGVIQVALARTVGRGSNGLFPFTIENASLSILSRGPRRTVITGVNDTSHLQGDEPIATRAGHAGGLTSQH